MTARIPDPDQSHLSADDRQALAALPDLALFRLLAHAPTVIRPWLALGGTLLASLELSARRRELAILTVAHVGRCRYEWVQHETIAAASGVTAEEIAAIAHDAAAAVFGPADAAVVRLAAEAVSDVEVSAEAIAAARAELGDRQTVELLCLAGYYVATAIVARSIGIDIDQPARLAVVEALVASRDCAGGWQ
jgi:AhpD family alkylhydroperoxidase